MTELREPGPKAEARESARLEVVAPMFTTADRYHQSNYLAWCETNNQPARPADPEQTLLRFLHSTATARDWSHTTCCAAALGVAKLLMSEGLPDPRGYQVQGWLKARLRETGRRTTRPVDALVPAEVQSSLGKKEASAAGDLLAHRAFMALVDILEENEVLVLNPVMLQDPSRKNRRHPAFPMLATLAREHFTVRADQIHVRVADETVVIAKRQTPQHYEMVALAVSEGGPFPLCTVSPDDLEELGRYLRRLTKHARSAVSRTAGWMDGRASADSSHAPAAEWWAAADRDQRCRAMLLRDQSLPRRAQDAAFLLMGLSTLFRNAELVRLNIGHLSRRPDGSGIDYRLETHKGALHATRHGSVPKPLAGVLEHVAAERPCAGLCAACALDRQLEIRRWQGAAATDPLFVAHNSPIPGPLLRLVSLQQGRRVVKQAAATEFLEDGTPRRLGTRSMRVSGATWLHQDGMSYEELCDVGSWSHALYARLYVRRYDPWASGEFVLGLPAAASATAG